MTTVDFIDNDGVIDSMQEMFVLTTSEHTSGVTETCVEWQPANKTIVAEREYSVAKKIVDNGGTILSLKTELLSKRRYKRRLAKEQARMNKRFVRSY